MVTMAQVAKKHKERLKDIQEKVKDTLLAQKENSNRYYEFREFAFKTGLSEADRSALRNLQRPIIEFNITNAPLSRLAGEFSKQEPAIYVEKSGDSQVSDELVDIVEGHIRHILWEAKKRNVEYETYRNSLAGGFSALEVRVDYKNDYTFQQEIFVDAVYDPTLVGFAPNTNDSTKSDSDYYFQLVPLSLSQFQREFPDVDTSKMSFRKSSKIMNWTYAEKGGKKMVVVCYFYEWKDKPIKLYKLADGSEMTEKEYEKALAEHEASNDIAVFPQIINERKSRDRSICRYTVVENDVIEYKKTVFKKNNIIFVDGDSITLKDDSNSVVERFTKPYIYHAKGLQRLVNLAGQTIANDFNNMSMHKIMVPQEALPDNQSFLEAYENFQVANTLVYKAFRTHDDTQPLPPPSPVGRIPLPQEVLATFNNAMPMLQNILGSYDAALGINDNQLSGTAIVEGATQSNAAAMPYVVNFMLAWNEVGQRIAEAMPIAYADATNIPIVRNDGSRGFAQVNQPGYPSLDYKHTDIGVRVEAGVSFAVAKNQALNQLISLMRVNPQISQFIAEDGLDQVIGNLDYHGSDVLEERAKAFMQEQQQAKQKAQGQQNPQTITAQANMIKAQTAQQELQLKAQENKTNAMLKAQELQNDQEKNETDRIEVLSKVGESQATVDAATKRAEAEVYKANVEAKTKIADHLVKAKESHHKQVIDYIKVKKEGEKDVE